MSSGQGRVTVTRLGAVREVLEAAVLCYFSRASQIAVHALAVQPYQVSIDLGKKSGRRGHEALKDMEKKYGAEIHDGIREPQNFLKHADLGRPKTG